MVLTAPFVPQFALSYLAFDCYIAGTTGNKNVAASLLTAGKLLFLEEIDNFYSRSSCSKFSTNANPAPQGPISQLCNVLSVRRREHVCLVSPLHNSGSCSFRSYSIQNFIVLRLGWNIKQSVGGADRVMEENMPPTSSLLP